MSFWLYISFSDFLILLGAISIAVKADKIDMKRKPYNEKLPVQCPGCVGNSDCSVTINDAATNTYPVVNSTLTLPADDWNVHGKVTCGNGIEKNEYHICPSYNGELSSVSSYTSS